MNVVNKAPGENYPVALQWKIADILTLDANGHPAISTLDFGVDYAANEQLSKAGSYKVTFSVLRADTRAPATIRLSGSLTLASGLYLNRHPNKSQYSYVVFGAPVESGQYTIIATLLSPSNETISVEQWTLLV